MLRLLGLLSLLLLLMMLLVLTWRQPLRLQLQLVA